MTTNFTRAKPKNWGGNLKIIINYFSVIIFYLKFEMKIGICFSLRVGMSDIVKNDRISL